MNLDSTKLKINSTLGCYFKICSKVILCFALLTYHLSSGAYPVYEMENEKGETIYTDQPQPGAKEVELDPVNTVTMPNTQVKKAVNKKKKDSGVKFNIVVTSPKPNATVRSNQGQVRFHASLSPKAKGHFELIVDNKTVATSLNGLFTVNEINRGQHSFQIKFINNRGKTLASSSNQTFFLHKASALISPN